MHDLRGLENETAEVRLNAIKEMAPQTATSAELAELANAYAAVVDTAPGPRPADAGRIR
jgi:hypothetical protein